MISIKLFSQIFCKLLLAHYALDLRSLFRQTGDKNYRAPRVPCHEIFEPFVWSCESEVSASAAKLLQWSELASSLSEPFVLWWHPDERSNFAFSTAWDFIKVFKSAWKRSQPAQITLGGWLSIWVSPCQSTPCFYLDLQFMLDAKSNRLFP